MALKTGFSTLVLGTLLLGSSAALADGTHGWTQTQGSAGWSVEVSVGNRAPSQWQHEEVHSGTAYQAHVHTGGCNHAPAPRPPPRQDGRYELQTVQRWVEGYHSQVWVPERCDYKPRRNVTKCRGGYYEQQWVPGRYETVQEWVWVPAPRWNQHRAAPATYYP